jgi:hypothetical protein
MANRGCPEQQQQNVGESPHGADQGANGNDNEHLVDEK